MWTILRAFAWMRWRIFLNTLNYTSGRDAVQRVSLVLERLAPLLMIAVLVPSAIALGGLAILAGFQLVSAPQQTVWFQLLRFLLFGGVLAALIGPILMPSGDRTNPVRLLLLPIPARTLYVSHVAGALSDPWVFLQIPIVIGLPIGLLAAGGVRAAAVAAVAGALFVLLVIGIAAATTTVIHLALRDRRRGEIIALILIVFLPMVGLLPALLGPERRARGPRTEAAEQRRGQRAPAWAVTAGRQALALAPSELYATAVRATPGGGTGAAARRVGGLAIVALAAHAAGLALFRRVMTTTGTTGPRRATSLQGVWSRGLPGVAPGTSAVALALLRLALRTPRGRATLLSPIVLSIFFAIMMLRGQAFDAGPFAAMRNAWGFAVFVALLGLISSLPISMNQFAVDRAGLTMTLLSPLSTRQILIGKAIGTGLIAVPPTLLCVTFTGLAAPPGQTAVWLALLLSVGATYILASPAAVLLSAIFPRVVNMNSVGSGSNAHGVAGFAGLLLFPGAALPCAALMATAIVLLERPVLAPLFVLGWLPAALFIAHLLFRAVEPIVEKRRESLATLM